MTSTCPAVHSSIVAQISEMSDGYAVRAYNNDHTTFADVVQCLVDHVPCHPLYASVIAREIHETGSAIAMEGDLVKCERLQAALKKIAVESDIIAV